MSRFAGWVLALCFTLAFWFGVVALVRACA